MRRGAGPLAPGPGERCARGNDVPGPRVPLGVSPGVPPDVPRTLAPRTLARQVSSGGELVLLHGNELRLRMLVNLVAELNSHGLFNALLLGFTAALCDGLRVRGTRGMLPSEP